MSARWSAMSVSTSAISTPTLGVRNILIAREEAREKACLALAARARRTLAVSEKADAQAAG
jgi:hypothetical protein